MIRAVALIGASLLLAACTAGTGEGPATSPTPTASAAATPEQTQTPAPTPTPSASPEPTETATVAPPAATTDPSATQRVESARLAATIPADWQSCDDAAGRASSIAVDVLGAWVLDGDCATGTVLVIEALPVPQGGITAQVYYEQVMVPNAQSEGSTLTRELFTTEQGIEGVIGVQRGDLDGARFAVSEGEMVVLGTLDGPTIDDATIGATRDVARTLEVS